MIVGNIKLLPRWSQCDRAGVRPQAYKNDVYFDLALGAELTVLTQERADYVGFQVEGPFKGGDYRN